MFFCHSEFNGSYISCSPKLHFYRILKIGYAPKKYSVLTNFRTLIIINKLDHWAQQTYSYRWNCKKKGKWQNVLAFAAPSQYSQWFHPKNAVCKLKWPFFSTLKARDIVWFETWHATLCACLVMANKGPVCPETVPPATSGRCTLNITL